MPCQTSQSLFSLTIDPVPQVLPISRTETRNESQARAFDVPKPLALWHLSSLDAPTVALVWSLAFAWAAGVTLPRWIPALQALAVWSAYMGDRLLDARSALRAAQPHQLRERHLFHWRHRRIFVPLAVASACVCALIVLFLMPAGARVRNSILAVAALLYFTRVHFSSAETPFRPWLPLITKELLVGLLFTAGCVLPSLSRARTANPSIHSIWPLAGAALFFALLAWHNCHSIECWESSPTHSHRSRIFIHAAFLACAGLLLALILGPLQPRAAALVACGAASALLLALLDRSRSRLTPVALRAGADLVLLTPALLASFALKLR